MKNNIWTEAEIYMRDYGKTSYSPTECLYLISSMLATWKQSQDNPKQEKPCA